MPRYKNNSLESVAASANIGARRSEVLREAPVRERDLGDRAGLVGLGGYLLAARAWARQLAQTTQARLMIAATLRPVEVARVFDHLLGKCDSAARPLSVEEAKSGQPPRAEAAAAEADVQRIMHLLEVLGEYVTGSWYWVPIGTGDGDDGDEMKQELEYAEPADGVTALVESREILRTSKSFVLSANEASEIRATLLMLAVSASQDVQETFSESPQAFGAPAIEQYLDDHHGELLESHRGFVMRIREVRDAVMNPERYAASDWRNAHHCLVDSYAGWISGVPAVLGMSHVNRQAYKRGLISKLGYLSQYAFLLQGNHASYELTRMIDVIDGLTLKLTNALCAIGAAHERGWGDSSFLADVGAQLDRLLVPEDVEQRWRDGLGAHAELAGRLIVNILESGAHEQGLLQSSLMELPACQEGLTAKTSRSRKDALENLLSKMQVHGLACKIPARAFRIDDGRKVRTGARKNPHVGRQWWFNPLGAVLVQR